MCILASLTVLVGCQGISSSKTQNQQTPPPPPPPPSSSLSLSSSSLSFGNVGVTLNKTLPVTATNNGSAKVTISSAASTAGQFSLSGPTLPLAIAAGKSATLNISFSPTAGGDTTGTLTFTSDASNSSVALSLSGSGITAPQLTVSPTALSWGEVFTGANQGKPASLTNTGGSSLSISQALVTGSGFSLSGLTLPLTLTPGESANFNVVFAPSAAGSASGNVAFTSDASSSALNLPLSAAGATPIAPGPSGQGIPPSYFGMDVLVSVFNGTPWPPFSFGTIRLWDSGTSWLNLNTSNGVYDFSQLDIWLQAAQQQGLTDVMYTFGETPVWASSNPNDQTCVSVNSPAGSCDAPSDLNPDGSGTDQMWKDFVTALVAHSQSSPYAHITSWEMWNEPTIVKEWNGTLPQLARMSKDAYTIIKAADPSAVVTTPTPVSIATLSSPAWMTQYIAATHALGSGSPYADIITFHGYLSSSADTRPENIVTNIAAMTTMQTSEGVSSLPLWDTESDWGNNSNLPDPDFEAAFLARFYLLQWSSNAVRFYWYQYGNTTFGSILTGNDLSGAGVAYGVLYNWMAGATLSSPCSDTGTVWTCHFTKPGGIQQQAVWDTSQTCSNGTCGTSTYTPDSLYTRYQDLTGTITQVPAGTTVQIGAKPILLVTP